MNRFNWNIVGFAFALALAVSPLTSQAQGETVQPWRQTVLHVLVALPSATHRRSAKSVEILIALGAEVNARDKSGSTPLKALLSCQNPEIGEEELRIIEALAHAGADLNLPDNTGSTPLACAIQTAHFAATAKLISLDAELNPILPGGQNYAHMAAQLGADKAEAPHIMQALIVAGVDFNTLDDLGRTPMQIAGDTGNQIALRLLLQHDTELVPIGEVFAKKEAEIEISEKGANTIKVGERLVVRTARGDYSIFAGRPGPGRRKARASPAAALHIQKQDKVYRKRVPRAANGPSSRSRSGIP